MAMNNMKVLLGMSGGVDSSVAALLLKQKGYNVLGITLMLSENDDGSAAKDAKAVCEALGLSHVTEDLRDVFRQHVTDHFVAEYKAGRTPNPCVTCNKMIKFGEMLKFADKYDCPFLATGHYAKVVQEPGGSYALKKAVCVEKDQTYFLYTLSQNVLARVLMPLGDYTKEEVRTLAEENGLLVARKKDSQDICFIPDGNKDAFLAKYLPDKPGNFLDTDGNIIGTHKGAFRYTIGQRKGLGMGFGRPMFVLSVDTQNNTVTLGEAGTEFRNHFLIKDCTFSVLPVAPDALHCHCKVRYSAKEVPCLIEKTGDSYRVTPESPVRAITPGQAAVFYHGDTLLGGGTIIE